MGNENKGNKFFRDNEGIFIISENRMEKQQVEDGLNRAIERIGTMEKIIDTITSLNVGGNVINASILITKEISPEIRQNFTSVVELLEVVDIKVFEIGIDPTVNGAYRFVDIMEFVKFARNQERKDKISYVKDEEQRTILEELQYESDVQKETIKELNGKIEASEKEQERLEFKIDGLKQDIEKVYKVERDDAVEKLEGLREELEEVKRIYENEKVKSEKYREEKDIALGDLTDVRVERDSYLGLYKEKEEEIRKLNKKLSRKENSIRDLIKEKEDLMVSRVDSEEIVKMNKKLEKERKEREDIEGQLSNLYIKYKQEKFKVRSLEDDIKYMREGEDGIREIGRTLNVDRYQFEKLDLYYIKVFEQLPYFRKAARIFFEKLSEKYGGRTHLIILKHDDGLDSEYFEGVPLWSKIEDIPEEDKIVRLYPNPYVFAGARIWEREVDMVIIVDYMKNQEYYATSISKERVMTVVRKEEDIEEYGLRGSPIALDGNTVYDIKYDNKIDRTKLSSNREGILRGKVETWVNNIN